MQEILNPVHIETLNKLLLLNCCNQVNSNQKVPLQLSILRHHERYTKGCYKGVQQDSRKGLPRPLQTVLIHGAQC